MSETAPVLDFRISADYGGPPVLENVAAAVAPGEIAALVGLSGSGKSTLALALLRLLQYRGGRVTGTIALEGRELTGLGERAMRTIRGRRVGYVPQNPSSALNEKVRVGTLLDECWKAHSQTKPDGGSHAALLERVRLPSDPAFLNQRAGQLSTGQGQRLLIALAIMHSPALIIADEPTSALDAITQSEILALFVELNRTLNTAILLITHDLLSVAAVGHRVDILHRGTIVESGAPAAIFAHPRHPFTARLVAAMPRSPVE